MRGFTLVEMLIVLGVITLITTATIEMYGSARSAGDARHAAYVYTDAIKEASLNARSLVGDSSWGVRIAEPEITVFAGSSYASRDTDFDIVYDMPGSVVVSGFGDVIFERMSGMPSSFGTTTFSNAVASTSIYLFETGVYSGAL